MTHAPDDIELARSCERGWAQAGRTGVLKELLQVQLEEFKRGTETGFRIGQTYLLLGRPDEALPYFEASFSRHMILLIAMPECGYAKSLAKDPGYAALFSRIRMAMHGGKVAQPEVVPITYRLPE
jgi:hypothetical protein